MEAIAEFVCGYVEIVILLLNVDSMLRDLIKIAQKKDKMVLELI